MIDSLTDEGRQESTRSMMLEDDGVISGESREDVEFPESLCCQGWKGGGEECLQLSVIEE